MNVNRGACILLRLRSPENANVFLQWHDILGTAIHELTHMEISEHSAEFYTMLDALYTEVEKDEDSGAIESVNDGVKGTGQILGGKTTAKSANIRRAAAAAAAIKRNKLFVLSSGSGMALGGSLLKDAKPLPTSREARRAMFLNATVTRLQASQPMKDPSAASATSSSSDLPSSKHMPTQKSTNIDEKELSDMRDTDDATCGSSARHVFAPIMDEDALLHNSPLQSSSSLTCIDNKTATLNKLQTLSSEGNYNYQGELCQPVASQRVHVRNVTKRAFTSKSTLANAIDTIDVREDKRLRQSSSEEREDMSNCITRNARSYDPWSCRMCTLLNDASLLACKLCETIRIEENYTSMMPASSDEPQAVIDLTSPRRSLPVFATHQTSDTEAIDQCNTLITPPSMDPHTRSPQAALNPSELNDEKDITQRLHAMPSLADAATYDEYIAHSLQFEENERISNLKLLQRDDTLFNPFQAQFNSGTSAWKR